MTIKDVEKLTGLTAKSIRYYEEKGLISVERNQENAYRSYTEENVNSLKWIKLLRRLDFSVEEIETIFHAEPDSVGGIFERKAESYEDKIQNDTVKKELCLTLIQDYGKGAETLEEYEETVRFLEGDEFEELRETMKDITTPSLSLTIIESLIFLGPVGWLFINIGRKFYAGLMFSAVLAVLSSGYLTFLWINYFRKYKYSKGRVKEKNKKTAAAIPLMLLAIVLAFAALIAVLVLAEKILAPEGWLFYQQKPWAEILLVVLVVIPVLMGVFWIDEHVFHVNREAAEDENLLLSINTLAKRYKLPALILWLLGMYVCLINAAYVTEDTILCRSTFCPTGKEYTYGEVEKAVARFGSSRFSFVEYKRRGQFSYTICLDGKKVVFSVPSVNGDIERYNENTYLELEEFDSALMELGIEKEGSTQYQEYCDLDTEYVERFVRIIENETK